MGQRANVILIERGRHTVYYTHWRANTLPRDLFWGPRYAWLFARTQRLIEDGSLLDEVWAEGGAVIDRDEKVLLVFGGDDVRYEVPLRRVYLRLVRSVWEGWDVRWAYEGVADLADYIGRPRAQVLSPGELAPADPDLSPPEDTGWTSSVGSVRVSDRRLKLFPLDFDGYQLLYRGPRLLEVAATAPCLEQLHFEECGGQFPGDGFHIDIDQRTIDFWTGRDAADAPARVAIQWPDWSVTWHRDRYESQIAAVGPALRFPTPRNADLLQRLRTMLLIEDQRSGPELLLDFLQHPGVAESRDVEVNEYALRDARLSLPREHRVQVVDDAIESMSRSI